MKLNIVYMNGSPTTVRGIPAICLITSLVDEWIEYNTTVPTYIGISKVFREKLDSEFGARVDIITTLVGDLRVVDKDLEDYIVELY